MSLYDELGVTPDATQEEIAAAHRRRVKETHPDKPDGSAEAFHRVQGAFRVLSDQSKRQRYDETGVEEEQSTEAMLRATALNIVAGKAGAYLTDPKVDPRYFDLVVGIRELLAQDKAETNAGIAESRRIQERMKQFARRLKRKQDAKGPDQLARLLEAQIEGHAGRLAALEDQLKVLVIANELVDEYVYKVEPHAQVMQPGRMYSGGANAGFGTWPG